MAFLHFGSRRLAYELHGSSGPLVALVMGLGMPGAAWAPQISALGPSYRLLTFDHPGIHASDALPGLPSVPELAADLGTLLAHLGARTVHLVGISMGSQIALATALAAPARAASLTLLSTWSGRTLWLPTLANLRWTPAVVLRSGPPHYRALARQLFSRRFRASLAEAEVIARLSAGLGPRPSARNTLGQFWSLLRYDAGRQLGALAAVPTLVVHGGADCLVPVSRARELARRIPGARFELVAGCGHGLSMEAAAEVNRLLAEHFAAAGELP